MAAASSPASAGWKILLDTSDITAPCAPIPAGKIPGINIVAVAPILGIQARISGQTAVIIDANGNEWRGRSGGLSLEGTARSLVLTAPLRLFGNAIYVP